jgi:lysylphosphatidylglycerol synthetase-like protein (DUF2156 family)
VVAGDPELKDLSKNKWIKQSEFNKFCDFAKSKNKKVCGYYFSEAFEGENLKTHVCGVSFLAKFSDLKQKKIMQYKKRCLNRFNKFQWTIVEKKFTELTSKELNMAKNWLKQKKLMPIKFLLKKIEDDWERKQLFYVLYDKNQHPLAITSLFFSSDLTMVSLNHMIKSPKSPNLSMDVLIFLIMEDLEKKNISELNFGFVPFVFDKSAKSFIEKIFQKIAKDSFFYNSKGLYNFKQKFCFHKTQRYLITYRNSLSSLYAIYKATFL